jgi:hypothetical protein
VLMLALELDPVASMEPAVSAVLAQQVSARPVRHRHGSALARSPRRPLPGARASNQ